MALLAIPLSQQAGWLSREGGKPVILFNMPCGVLLRKESILSWIPACARMTGFGFEVKSRSKFIIGSKHQAVPPVEAGFQIDIRFYVVLQSGNGVNPADVGAGKSAARVAGA